MLIMFVIPYMLVVMQILNYQPQKMTKKLCLPNGETNENFTKYVYDSIQYKAP